MSRPGHLNAPCPIILRTRCPGTLAAARAAHFNPVGSPPCGNDGSHIAGFSGYTALKESKPMKPGLRPGASRVNRITIGPERTISFMGEDARTYATPAMIRDIEYTCRDLIMEHADPGEDSVGMEVAVKHLAPTLLGMTVEIAVRVLTVDGRKVSFDVAVKDELDNVGAGTHTRFVVDKAKTFERLKAKAARFAARSE
jgi:fluoroacetyl-CoA thioesterase